MATSWGRGGGYVPWQGLILWSAAALLMLTLLSPMLPPRKGHAGRALAQRLKRILTDPIFYLGAAFLLLLVIQWWNSGRIRLFDMETGQWIFSDPPHPNLPSAITKGEAREMLSWFFPPWCVLLAVRCGVRNDRTAHHLVRLILLNAAALALLGITQFLSETSSLFWSFPMEGHFFASFGYPNHAGALFVLSTAVSLGLLLHEIMGRPGRMLRIGRTVAFSVLALLVLASANLCLTQASILLSWIMVTLTLAMAAKHVWHRLTPAKRVNLAAGCLALALGCHFIVGALGSRLLAGELTQLEGNPAEEVRGRWAQAEAAVSVWRKNLWFGVGGWGYRYFVDDHADMRDGRLERHEWENSVGMATGMANAHNDPAQFLAEFGAVGAGLMATVVFCLVLPLRRGGRRGFKHPVARLTVVGLVTIALYSLMDIPFRCPAMIQHWLVFLALLPLLALHPDIPPPSEDGRSYTEGLRDQDFRRFNLETAVSAVTSKMECT